MKDIFSEIGDRRTVTAGGQRFELPALYFRSDVFFAFYGAGEELAGLGLGRSPVLSGDFLDSNMILPEGEGLGPV